jgi:hypothetical protein
MTFKNIHYLHLIPASKFSLAKVFQILACQHGIRLFASHEQYKAIDGLFVLKLPICQA